MGRGAAQGVFAPRILAGDLGADDVRGIGQAHGNIGKGGLGLLLECVDGACGLGHAGAEGHEQDALLGLCGLFLAGKGGLSQGQQERCEREGAQYGENYG